MDKATLDAMRAMLDRSDGIIEAAARGIIYLELQRRGIAEPRQAEVDEMYRTGGSVYRTDARAALRGAIEHLQAQ